MLCIACQRMLFCKPKDETRVTQVGHSRGSAFNCPIQHDRAADSGFGIQVTRNLDTGHDHLTPENEAENALVRKTHTLKVICRL